MSSHYSRKNAVTVLPEVFTGYTNTVVWNTCSVVVEESLLTAIDCQSYWWSILVVLLPAEPVVLLLLCSQFYCLFTCARSLLFKSVVYQRTLLTHCLFTHCQLTANYTDHDYYWTLIPTAKAKYYLAVDKQCFHVFTAVFVVHFSSTAASYC